MKKNDFIIPIYSEEEKFEKHLQLKSNSRIIFSGEYGTGKTYFLKSFFEKKKKYHPIFINPVRYSASSNEDIFELIKLDILLHLFTSDRIDFSKTVELNDWSLLSLYLINHPVSAITSLLPLISKLNFENESISEGLQVIVSIKKVFEELKKKIKGEIKKKYDNESEAYADFVDSFTQKPGSPYEMGFISMFISDILSSITEKEFVLVIDDLDRLDPDNIFRILSILSVHTEYKQPQNKFNFKKIILVCDIDNIEESYCYKYGSKKSFVGYINKFYSNEIFRFNNFEKVKEYVDSNASFGLSENSKGFVINFIKLLVEEGCVKIREVEKLFLNYNYVNDFNKRIFEYNNNDKNFDSVMKWKKINFICEDRKNLNIYIEENDVELIRIMKILNLLIGDKKRFKEIIKEFVENKKGFHLQYKFLSSIVIFNQILRSEDRKENVVFSIYKDDNLDKFFSGEFNNYSEPKFQHPSGNVGVVKYELKLNWDKDNSYKGDCSYYKDIEVNFINNNLESHFYFSFNLYTDILIRAIEFTN